MDEQNFCACVWALQCRAAAVEGNAAGNAETTAPLSLSDSVAFPLNFRISLKPIVYKTICEVARVDFWVVPSIGSLSIALYTLTTDVMKTISCLL